MKRKLKWTTVIGWLLAVEMLAAVVVIVVSASDSPVDAALEFSKALIGHDAKALGPLTYLPETSRPAEEQWAELFRGPLKDLRLGVNPEPLMVVREGDEATVKFTYYLVDQPGQERDVQLLLVKNGGKWQVDVRRLSRSLISATPL